MRLQDAIPQKGSQTRPRRLGRGISAGQGASCGKGMRGQKSRSGSGTRPGFEGGQNPLYRRLPKLKTFPMVRRKQLTVVNVSTLANIPANTEVNLAYLLESKVITGDYGPLKILGDGEIKVALKVQAVGFTASAKEKIEAAGGTCEIISGKSKK
ncbi:MAG: 50S ribosomal protein L15 [Microcoleaceae cyanobacterium]|jgi:large subunit ribosomal protein L15